MDGVILVRACATALLGAALAVTTACDLAWRVIPNGSVAAVALAWLLVRGSGQGVIGGLANGLAGALLVLALMLCASRASLWLGQGAGVGGGDVKLLVAAGLWAGPVWGLALVGASCVLGLLGHGALALARQLAGDTSPLGRGIALGPAIALCLAAFLLAP